MTLSSISCFLKLAETLSFSQTALELFISQQGVSKCISKLERELGTKLFLRDHHNVELTLSGKKYYEFFTDFRSRFEEIRKELSEKENDYENAVRIGLMPGLDFGPSLYGTMQQMKSRKPGFLQVCERQSPSVLESRLLSGKLDMIIVYERFVPQARSLCTRKIANLPLTLAVSAYNPLAGTAKSYRDFSGEVFIFDSIEESGKRIEANRQAWAFAGKMGLNPKEVMIVDNRETAFTFAEQNQGFIVTTSLNSFTRKSTVKCFPLEKTEPLVAVWNEGMAPALIDDYLDIFAQQTEDLLV